MMMICKDLCTIVILRLRKADWSKDRIQQNTYFPSSGSYFSIGITCKGNAFPEYCYLFVMDQCVELMSVQNSPSPVVSD